jgi:CNT family concentrative nucleoside transporter
MANFYYLRIMQIVVQAFARLKQKKLGTTGPESLAAAANIFLGQTEAPLVVRPYVRTMTRSELMAIMVPGFASTAGGVLAAYVSMGIDAGHLVAASVMSAPAGLLIAKVIVPETEKTLAPESVSLEASEVGVNLIESAAIGATQGLRLALEVGAMLIVFLALIAMVDGIVGWVGGQLGWQWSLATALGYLFAPMALLMGVEPADCLRVGELLGVRMVTNELVSYEMLAGWMREGSEVSLSPRSQVIVTYALCGFANFGSIGIQIGGIGGMAPARRTDLAQLGMRAMLGGTLAGFMTACIAGMLI